jgi:N-acetylglucosamine kinase-like BadF-type ATPase
MLIIVDSGSTKADWQILKADGSQELHHTMGFNPFFVDEDRVEKELKKDFVHQVDVAAARWVYFYGAGCSDRMRCDIIKRGLTRIFTNAETIEVEHDLLASARATCGIEPGIACIIGTGSNTCLYDGKDVIDNISNLGYLLGDEGAGSHLGKLLIRAYFYRELPDDMIQFFEAEFGNNKRAILNLIYGDAPNVYLASYAKFFSAHRNHFYIQKLANEAFTELIRRHILKYDGCHHIPIHFVGSVAYHFRDILKTTLEEHDLSLGIIIQKPIEALVDFHLKHINTGFRKE